MELEFGPRQSGCEACALSPFAQLLLGYLMGGLFLCSSRGTVCQAGDLLLVEAIIRHPDLCHWLYLPCGLGAWQ